MKVPVLIPRIFNHPHTYLSGKFGKLKPGSIVSVPFGREKEIGVNVHYIPIHNYV